MITFFGGYVKFNYTKFYGERGSAKNNKNRIGKTDAVFIIFRKT